MAGWCGPIFRKFADKSAIYVADLKPVLCRKPHGMAQENMARGAFPLRVGRREMLSDITHAQRAIDRVGDRMHPDIGVGMPLQAAPMRDLARRTAKHDRHRQSDARHSHCHILHPFRVLTYWSRAQNRLRW